MCCHIDPRLPKQLTPEEENELRPDRALVKLKEEQENILCRQLNDLLALVKQLEDKKMKLTDTLLQQTERRMRILNDFLCIEAVISRSMESF